MNGRSAWVTFFIFLLLFVLVVLQILTMVQADRLYERLSRVLEKLPALTQKKVTDTKQGKERANLPMKEYPGDEGDWLVWCLRSEPRTLNTISVDSDTYTNYVVVGSIFE